MGGGESGGYLRPAAVAVGFPGRSGDGQVDGQIVVGDPQVLFENRYRRLADGDGAAGDDDGFRDGPFHPVVFVHHYGDVGVTGSFPDGDADAQRVFGGGPRRLGGVGDPEVIPRCEGGGVGVQSGGAAGRLQAHHHGVGGVDGQLGGNPHGTGSASLPQGGHRRPVRRIAQGNADAVV